MGQSASAESWRGCTSYWEPAHIVPSAWIEHAPFAYWLMGTLRPRTVVELGTHYGFSYFVFAEAATRLELATRVFGVDTWKGDDHAGFYSDEVYQSVDELNRTRYGDVGTLIRKTFDDAVDEFDDGSIDLLHIDGRHGFEDVRHDFTTWLSKLSERGVIIMHDIAARRPGFGVWQYWEDLKREYPLAFGFEHGFGLGVVPVGVEQSADMQKFFDAAARESDTIRAWYAEVGGRIGARAEASATMKRTIERLEESLESTRRENEALNRDRDAILQTTSWRITRPLRAVRSALRAGAKG